MRHIHDNSSLIYIMTWILTDNKPFPEPMMTQFTKVYLHHQASMCNNVAYNMHIGFVNVILFK